jgi:hypothetical protein
VDAVEAFRTFIADKLVYVISDHKPITHDTTKISHNGKLARWNLTLQSFNLKWKWIAGRANSVGDFLSRLPSSTDELFDEYQEYIEEKESRKKNTDDQKESQAEEVKENKKHSKEKDKVDKEIEDHMREIAKENKGGSIFLVDSDDDDENNSEDDAGDIGSKFEPDTQTHNDWSTAQEHDDHLKQFIDYLTQRILPKNDKDARHILLEAHYYKYENNLLYRINCCKRSKWEYVLCVPHSKIDTILFEYHDTKFSAHASID